MAGKLFTIPDASYQATARVVADFRRNSGDTSVVEKDIEAVLRSYVDLGQRKEIEDYYSNLSDPQKDDILTQLYDRVLSDYQVRASYAKLLTDLDIVDTQSRTSGSIPEPVAHPRKWQENYEAALVQSQADTDQKHPGGIFSEGIESFFNVVRTFLESTFKGLGLNLSLPILIIIAVAVVGFIILHHPSIA